MGWFWPWTSKPPKRRVPFAVGPMLGDKVGAIDPTPTKIAGSIISCPNDHWLYRLTRDITRGEGRPMRATDVECVEDTMPKPEAGKPAQVLCSYCGEGWRRRFPNGQIQTHFTTGWWPDFRGD